MKANRTDLLLIATIVVWIIAYVAWTADWLIGPAPHVLERALRRIPVCLAGAGSCWLIRSVLDRMAARPARARWLAAIAMCILAVLAYECLNTLVFYILAPHWGPTTIGAMLQNAMMIVWVFFAWAALYFAIDASVDASDTRLRLAESRSAALRARNHALAQQISPHFLFNALNTVSGLILEGEPARAERVTVSLAALLRRSLETDMREFVPLGEEMDAIHRYIEIAENRFEDRFIVDEQIPAGLRSLAVPPLILQPLVENAVKHGVARSSGAVRLSIAAMLAGPMLRILVSDDAEAKPDGQSPAGPGIGHANVRQRLALLYDGRATLSCAALPERGYVCELLIPASQHVAA